MEFKIEKKALMENIKKSGKAITGISGNAILDGLYLSVADGKLKTIGSDGNLTIISKSEGVNVTVAGEIIIDNKIFSQIIGKLPDDEISIKTEENSLVEIKCCNSKFNLVYNSADNYPAVSTEQEGSQITFKQRELKEIVESVQYAAALDDARPILKGLLFEIKEGFLNAVTLDGYRLAKKTIEVTREHTSGVISIKPVLDNKNMVEIARLLKDSDDEVTMIVNNNQAVFTFENTTIMTRLLEGSFVNYSSLIPTEFLLKTKINRQQLVSSLERAALVGNNNNKLVKLVIGENEMAIEAKSQLGQVKEDLAIEKDGDNTLTIAFNIKYLLDALKATNDSEIVFNLSTEIKPVVIEGVTDTSSTHLILPVRIV